MKKILFLLHSMNIGGTEKAFLNMISTDPFADEYEITLLLLQKEGGFLPFVPPEVKTVTLDGYDGFRKELSVSPKDTVKGLVKRGRLLSLIKYLYRHLHFRATQDRTAYWRELARRHHVGAAGQYDIAVAYHGPDDFVSFCVLELIDAAQKVQWIHFDVAKYVFHEYFARRNYPRFDRIYAVSDEARASLIKRVPAIRDKARTYLNRISPDLCLQMADEGQGFADPFEGRRILTVGRLSEEKGQDTVAQIARKLLDEGVRFRWYIIGDGPLRGAVEREIEKHGVESTVILLGATPNPYPYFKQASLYVQTSHHEGFGLTVAEAKVFGLPVVSTDVTGAGEQLAQYPKGFIVHDDADAMARTIKKVLLGVENGTGIDIRDCSGI